MLKIADYLKSSSDVSDYLEKGKFFSDLEKFNKDDLYRDMNGEQKYTYYNSTIRNILVKGHGGRTITKEEVDYILAYLNDLIDLAEKKGFSAKYYYKETTFRIKQYKELIKRCKKLFKNV